MSLSVLRYTSFKTTSNGVNNENRTESQLRETKADQTTQLGDRLVKQARFTKQYNSLGDSASKTGQNRPPRINSLWGRIVKKNRDRLVSTGGRDPNPRSLPDRRSARPFPRLGLISTGLHLLRWLRLSFHLSSRAAGDVFCSRTHRLPVRQRIHQDIRAASPSGDLRVTRDVRLARLAVQSLAIGRRDIGEVCYDQDKNDAVKLRDRLDISVLLKPTAGSPISPVRTGPGYDPN
ncbi:hypothetical protein HS088_TW05G00618 [Tripterygium wilfordii]|uniref:Uncharacterized protein n=1 Tax=Tripterygium wilfordii TaxID=458696 RepID=A0A7J7DNG3_TRIWF|nr:hypothetical protein HS088_TW05G00618 [Tripterygium wilfordii]